MSSSAAPPAAAGPTAPAPQPPVPTPKKDEDRPIHVLMLPPTAKQSNEMLLRDPSIQKDYISRRYKCYVTSNKKEQKDLWSAVTKVERAMVECCELGEEYDDSVVIGDDEDEELIYQGGALERGTEYQFVQLLARHCHTPVTRALALAILQHTIEQDEIDAQEELERLEKEKSDSESDGNDEDGDKKDDTTEQGESSTAQADDKQIVDAPSKEKTKESSTPIDGDTKVLSKKKEKPRISRIHRFYEAGGMRVLKQWLLDATTPAKKVMWSTTTSSGTSKRETIMRTTHSITGPLLLPLLSVLEGMPLDKGLVTETKINKQIRNLKKQLDEAIQRRMEKGDRFLEQWKDPIAGGLVVVDVQKAVESLMEKWQERAKTSTMRVEDPFVSLRETMRERLDILTQFETGKTPKPDWLSSLEESERIAKEKKEISKLSTRQLEARQRQQERAEVIKAMQHKQQEIQEKMAQMLEKKKEESRKRKAEEQEVMEKKKGKRVKWKDGFDNSDTLRKRKLLEQVYRYPAESSGRWDDDTLGEEGQDGVIKEEEDDAFDMFGDTETNAENSAEDGEDSGMDPQSSAAAVKDDPDFV